MTVEDVEKIDFVTGERKTGDMILTISDHLDWDENEGEHLLVLPKKLNTYLQFIESWQLYAKVPQAVERKIVIQVIGKFPLSEGGAQVLSLGRGAIERDGYSLRFNQLHPKGEKHNLILIVIGALDTATQLSLFVKLKLTNFARAGNRAGLFCSR